MRVFSHTAVASCVSGFCVPYSKWCIAVFIDIRSTLQFVCDELSFVQPENFSARIRTDVTVEESSLVHKNVFLWELKFYLWFSWKLKVCLSLASRWTWLVTTPNGGLAGRQYWNSVRIFKWHWFEYKVFPSVFPVYNFCYLTHWFEFIWWPGNGHCEDVSHKLHKGINICNETSHVTRLSFGR
jgi:hypothetical protein